VRGCEDRRHGRKGGMQGRPRSEGSSCG
jgi:hypothetical protein